MLSVKRAKYYYVNSVPYVKSLLNKWVIVWACVCVAFFVGVFAIINGTADYYLLSYNGVGLGYTHNINIMNDAINEVKSSFADNTDIINDLNLLTVSQIQTNNWFLKCYDKDKIEDVIVNASDKISRGYSVYINGKKVITLKNENVIQNAFEDYKKDKITISDDIIENYDSCNVEVYEDVRTVPEIVPENEAIYEGGYNALYDIFENELHYKIVCLQTQNQKIPYITYYTRDDSLESYKKKVVQKGVNGQKEVQTEIIIENGTLISKKTVSEKTVSKPVTCKIKVGAAYTVGGDSHSNLILPAEGYISSTFGYRNDPFTSSYVLHSGLDIAAVSGTNILAAADGVVVKASNTGDGYGNCVIIEHYSGFRTMYAHCSKLLVSVGDYVDAGDIIALVGSTGRSTGPHLHFSVIIDGKYVDPSVYFDDKIASR